MQWRNHRCVDGLLSTCMEWQAVSHDTIQCVGNSHVEVTDEGSACFATCPCGCTLQSRPSPSQDSCSMNKLHGGCQGRRVDSCTGSCAKKRARGKTKAAQSVSDSCFTVSCGEPPQLLGHSESASTPAHCPRGGKCCVSQKSSSMRDGGFVLPSALQCPAFEVLWSFWRLSLHEPMQTKKAQQNQEPLPADRLHQQLRSNKLCADVPPTEPRRCRRPLGDTLSSEANCLPSWPKRRTGSHRIAQAQFTKHKWIVAACLMAST